MQRSMDGLKKRRLNRAVGGKPRDEYSHKSSLFTIQSM